MLDFSIVSKSIPRFDEVGYCEERESVQASFIKCDVI